MTLKAVYMVVGDGWAAGLSESQTADLPVFFRTSQQPAKVTGNGRKNRNYPVAAVV